jgi:hypothetical protein
MNVKNIVTGNWNTVLEEILATVLGVATLATGTYYAASFIHSIHSFIK